MLSSETPADVYERTIAFERKRASREVAELSNWSLGTHAAIPAMFGACCGGALFVGGVSGDVERLAFSLAGLAAFGLLLASFATGIGAGVATLRSWRVLRWRMRIYGLMPWALFATECAAALATFL